MDGRAIAFSAALLSGWALVHSITIADWFKRRVAGSAGSKIVYYRLAYNVFSLISFGVVWLLLPGGGEPVWCFSGAASFLFRMVQGTGVLFFFWSLKYIDVRSFTGLGAVCGCADGSTSEERAGPCRERLTRAGPFGICRHPMYLAGIMVLGFHPVMTQARLILFVWATLYFFLGSMHEERRLVREFGQEYIDYRNSVSRIIPWIWMRNRTTRFGQV